MRTLTPEQARLIIEAHGIFELLRDEDEQDRLEAKNPDLLHAYLDLQGIADGSD